MPEARVRLLDLADKLLVAVVQIDWDPKIDQARACVVRPRTTTGRRRALGPGRGSSASEQRLTPVNGRGLKGYR